MAVLGKHKYWRLYVTAYRSGYSAFYIYTPTMYSCYQLANIDTYNYRYYDSPQNWLQLIQSKVGKENITASVSVAGALTYWALATEEMYPTWAQVGYSVNTLPSWFKFSFTDPVELPVWFLDYMYQQIGSANIEYSDDDSQWNNAKTFTYADIANQNTPFYAGDYPIKVRLSGEHSVTTIDASTFVLGGYHTVRTTRFPLVLGGYHTVNAPPQSFYKPGLSNLEFRYSGGSANSLPNASLGGAMSSVEVHGQRLTTKSPIPGITLLRGSDNLLGPAKVKVFTLEDGSWWTQWEPSGISGTGAVNISGDGYYTLPTYGGTETGYVCIDVVFVNLVAGEYECWVDFNKNSLFDDVDYDESLAGDTSYRCVYLYNSHQSGNATNLTLYVKRDTLNPDSEIQLGLDPAGVGGTATTIGNEHTAPSGVSFSSPTKASPLTVGLLRYDLAVPVWIKRIIQPGNPFAIKDDSSLIGIHARF